MNRESLVEEREENSDWSALNKIDSLIAETEENSELNLLSS